MRNAFLIFVAGILMGLVSAQQVPNPYQPGYARLIEVSGASGSANPTGSLVVAFGPATPAPTGNNLVSVAPAFPPIVFGCGQLSTPAQIAQAISVNIAANGAASGFTAAVSSGNRVLVIGTQDFVIAVFHAEIDPIYGLPLPAYGLCDGIAGNEQSSMTTTGIAFTFVPVSDPQLGSFELSNGAVVPPNFTWKDGRGQVSVETVPAFGFPTAGSAYLKLTTTDPDPSGYPGTAVKAKFTYSSATPRIQFGYRWMSGESGPTFIMNDAFSVFVRTNYGYGIKIAEEDTFTPSSAGVRYEECDVRELFEYLNEGDTLELEFHVQNGGWNNLNDSTVFVDDIQFLPPATGEGNGSMFSASLRLTTLSWHPLQQWLAPTAANKKIRPGGALFAQLWLNGMGVTGGTIPFVVMVDLVPYGTNQSTPLPGEPNAIGLSSGMSVGLLGGWGVNLPPLPVAVVPSNPIFLPLSLPVDGVYLQAGIVDSTAPNGVRISNMVRHRFE